jgi:rhodanese-related sulfurtransferase
MFRRSGIAIVTALAFIAASCSSDNTSSSSTTVAVQTMPPNTAPTSSVDLHGIVMVLDVRTPEEFTAGHIDGAVNFDYDGGVLKQRLDLLVPDIAYGVYCHSGRRSALAVAEMKAAGFTDVRDLGSIDQASAYLGLPIVQ